MKLLLIWVVGACIHFRSFLTSSHNRIAGNIGDNRMYMALAEHWYSVFRGLQSWNAPGFFYPQSGVMAYTDTFFLEALPYSLLRLAGCDPYLAFEGQFVILTLIGFTCTALILRNHLGVRGPLALCGAALFTFSNLNAIWVWAAQDYGVMFIPAILLLAAHGVKTHSWKYCGCAGFLFGLLFFSTYYTAWFFGVFGLVAAAVYVAQADRLPWREMRLPVGAMVAGWILGLIPFFTNYGAMILAGVRRSYAEVSRDLLAVKDLWNVYHSNMVWGNLICSHCNLGSAYGFPLLTWIGCLAAGLWFCRRFVRGAHDAVTRMAVAVSAAILATAVLVIQVHGSSLWFLLWKWVPGASIIRVPGRFLIVAGFFVACLITIAIELLYQDAGRIGRVTLSGLCALLLVEQLNLEPFHEIYRDQELARLAVSAPPKSCTTFLVTSQDKGPPFFQLQIDAMLIAERFHVPTLNGYSGNLPEGWNLLEPRDPAYKENAMAWLGRKGYTGTVCSLDLASRRWSDLRLDDCASIRAKAPLGWNRVGAHFDLPAACLPGSVGSIVDTERVAEAGKASNGFLSFGPYLPLPQGKYTVTMHVQVEQDKAGAAGLWDVGYFCCGPVPAIVVAKGSLTADTREIRVELQVTPERVARGFEFRVEYLGCRRLVLERLSIVRNQ